jgi:hypothetical protein
VPLRVPFFTDRPLRLRCCHCSFPSVARACRDGPRCCRSRRPSRTYRKMVCNPDGRAGSRQCRSPDSPVVGWAAGPPSARSVSRRSRRKARRTSWRQPTHRGRWSTGHQRHSAIRETDTTRAGRVERGVRSTSLARMPPSGRFLKDLNPRASMASIGLTGWDPRPTRSALSATRV